MFKMNEIKELIRAVDRSELSEVVIKGDKHTELKIKKSSGTVVSEEVTTPAPVANKSTSTEQPAPVASPAKEDPAPQQQSKPEAEAPTSSDDSSLHKIVSPMVGTFYSSPSPDDDAYVKVGDEVKQESIVCIVEAMKLMNELEAEVNGEIVEILVENGQLIEYGQPLFLVKPA